MSAQPYQAVGPAADRPKWTPGLITSAAVHHVSIRFQPPLSFLLGAYETATSPSPQPHSLVETNVRFIADPLLEQKGFRQATDKPDIIVAIVYANELSVKDMSFRR